MVYSEQQKINEELTALTAGVIIAIPAALIAFIAYCLAAEENEN